MNDLILLRVIIFIVVCFLVTGIYLAIKKDLKIKPLDPNDPRIDQWLAEVAEEEARNKGEQK